MVKKGWWQMRVVIFGASGGTGLRLTKASLAAGYDVTVLARTPEKFPLREQVTVVQGDARDVEAIHKTVAGADVVLSALGARSPFAKDDTLERAIPLIVTAMRESGVRRIIALGSSGARADALKRQPALLRWFSGRIIAGIILRRAVVPQIAQWKILSESGLDFTMLMPPMLQNRPGRGVYRVDGDALPRGAMQISRDDVADFMMKQIAGTEWVGKGVYIAW
jgi:putative NADH-flavin reductase